MFNLVDQAWVPVWYADGLERDVSLAELYRDAPLIRELAIEFPLELVATLRMLVTIMQSALGGPKDIAEKARWLGLHDELAPAIVAYLQIWHHRFDLFDAGRPFMQRLVHAAGAPGTAAVLRADWASGNNATLFDHRADRNPSALDYGGAARALLATLHFQPAGGRPPGGNSRLLYRSDSPGARSLHAFVEADTMWQALVLNAPKIRAGDHARPIWERDKDHESSNNAITPLGWLDRATWRSRAIQLLPDDDGMVRACRLHQHLKIADGPLFDPYAPVRSSEGKKPAIMRASASKAIWRDAEALLRGLRDIGSHSTVVAEAVRVLDHLPAIRVVGQVVVRSGKVADIRDARLPVSRELLESEERLAFVGHLVDAAEIGAKALRSAVNAVATTLGAKDGWELARRWETRYWAARAQPFTARLAEIASGDVDRLAADLLNPWRKDVRSAARDVYDAYAQQGASAPRTAQAIAEGRSALERQLAKITPDKEQGR